MNTKSNLKIKCPHKNYLLGATFICSSIFLPINSYAVTIGPGDVYQQSTALSFEAIDLELQSGGSIIQRTDDNVTWFLGSTYTVSGGVVDADLRLDGGETLKISGGTFNKTVNIDRTQSASTEISGGLFTDDLTIDRMDTDSILTISGGIFDGSVGILRTQGDLIISGGNFNSTLSGTTSTTNGALPTTTFIGANWTLNGILLEFVGNELDLTGETGLLSGNLSDGNQFSASITGFGATELTVVNTVPIPTSIWLFGSGLMGLIGFARRKNL